MANIIAQLAVKLGLETADFTQALEAAKRGLESVAEKLKTAGTIGAGAFVAMTYKALEFSDRISDLADANDIAVEKILALSEALNLTGGSGENAGKILASFTTKIDAAAQGGKQAQEAFARIGVSLADIGKMSNEQLFDKTLKNLSTIPDVVQRNAIAFELLGKGIRGVSLKTLQEEMSKGTDAFKEYANAVKLAGDLHDKLEAKTTKTMLIFTKEVLPTLNAMFDTFNSKGGAAETIFATLKYTMIGMWSVAGEVSEAFMSISATINAIGKGDFGLKSGEYLNTINQLRLDKISRDRKIEELLKGPPPSAKGEDFSGRMVKAAKDAEADKQKQMLYTAGLISTEYQRQVDFSLQQLKIRDAMVGMTTDEKKIQEAINQQLDATSKKIDEITKLKEAAVGRGADQATLNMYDKQIEAVKKIGEEAAKTAKIIEQSSIEAQRTFSFGWNKSLKQYAEDANNYAKMGEESFNAITGNMSSAINKFVETGKLSFGDLASSIIKDLIKIQLQYMTMQMFSAGASWLGFGAGAAGAAGASASAGGFGLTAASVPSLTGGLMLASGGAIDSPAIVGENGPELFIPGRSGSIIPNNNMKDALGGGGITYNGPYIANMQAIDTQSAQQFLARNKASVWAANQSASRSIPTSR